MDSWLTNGSEKGAGLQEVNLEVRTRIWDIVNLESDITLPLLQGFVTY